MARQLKSKENCKSLPSDSLSDPVVDWAQVGDAGYTDDWFPMSVRLSICSGLGIAVLVTAVALSPVIRGAIQNREEVRSRLLGLVRVRQAEAGRFTGSSAAPGLSATPSHLELARLGRDLRVEAAVRPSAEAFVNLGLLSLAEGKAERAVSLMEKAAASQPDASNILNDLAACYL